MDRRTYLRRAGVAGIALLAGCQDGESDTASTVRMGTTPTGGVPPTPSTIPGRTPTDTPPPADTPTSEPASFEVVDVEAVDRVDVGEAYRFTLAVENVGQVDGTFRATVQASTPERDRWEDAARVEVEVPAGETVDWESESAAFEYLREVQFRVAGSGVEWSLDVVAATIGFGEPYDTPDGLELAVDGAELQDAYEYETRGGERASEPAAEGDQWAFVDVAARNASGGRATLPTSDGWILFGGTSRYDSASVRKEVGAYEGGEVAAGVERRGWVAYEIPASISAADLDVAWGRRYARGEVVVYWSP